MALPGYTFQGIYKQMRIGLGPGDENNIVAARSAQGLTEWTTSSQEEQREVVRNWRAILADVGKSNKEVQKYQKRVKSKAYDMGEIKGQGINAGAASDTSAEFPNAQSLMSNFTDSRPRSSAATQRELPTQPSSGPRRPLRQSLQPPRPGHPPYPESSDQQIQMPEHVDLAPGTQPHARYPHERSQSALLAQGSRAPSSRTASSSIPQQTPGARPELPASSLSPENPSLISTVDGQSALERAIQQSVAAISTGDPEQDQRNEVAIRASMMALRHTSTEGTRSQTQLPVPKASELEAQQRGDQAFLSISDSAQDDISQQGQTRSMIPSAAAEGSEATAAHPSLGRYGLPARRPPIAFAGFENLVDSSDDGRQPSSRNVLRKPLPRK